MSNPLIVFSKNQINKYDQFLPIIFEQVRRERELEANELKQLECNLEKALRDNEFSSLMNYTQISNSIVDKSAQQQQTVDTIRDQIKCFKRHLFFKRLVGHYKGPCGYAAKKGSSKRIWRKLRTIIALVNCHNEMHPTKRITEIEYNNGKNIDAFLPNLKHQLKNESWVRENVDGQWVFLPQKQEYHNRLVHQLWNFVLKVHILFEDNFHLRYYHRHNITECHISKLSSHTA